MPGSLDVRTQYDSIGDEYLRGFEKYDAESRARSYALLPPLTGARVLDIGCGDGTDVAYYLSQGAIAYGIDPSSELIEKARRKAPGARLDVGVGEMLPYADRSMDVITSTYALQTSDDVPKILSEAARVLRPGGQLIYSSKHPLRQFMEKRSGAMGGVNYFQQDIVQWHIFGGAVPLSEPSHTLQEYLSPEVLMRFDIRHFEERSDFPASDRAGNDHYPCYFIMRAVRR
ncbi:class I SAM-dependent methyltransferase [Chondromyces crocatus]|uniref:Methyltransferase type 11 domain-containing protein n=1 Tax=Chondromyces crocatus TaxID=52 RepID=A0A0K1EU18_CHOCO|nr:class I SAM-dependent methyltransferase [Chondromyces crocatus]AKT44118.1 uncharacterized protein CMC5_083580 [Chondromyces crocatus]